MTPEEIGKNPSEHMQQAALFAWAALSVGKYPMLKWMHAIPNGGARGNDARTCAIRGGSMKAEGVKPGVSDIFLPCAKHGTHGLYIEMKKKDGKPSKEQLDFKKDMQLAGYGVCICYSWTEARNVIIEYLSANLF